MKVVLDTNSLLQIVFPKSCYKEIWVSLLAQEYTICLTSEIMLEYREILERRFGSATFAEEVMELIASLPNVEYVNPAYRFNLITADPDDNGGGRDVDNIVDGTSSWTVPSLPEPPISSATTAISTNWNATTSPRWMSAHSPSSSTS